MLATVGRWRRKTAGHGRQSPLLDVCFDEDKAHLAKVDLDVARPICSHSREEVLCLEAMRDIVELLSVASEKDSAGARPVAYTNDVALFVVRSVVGARERLVVPSLAARCVCNGPFMPA